MDMLLSCGTAQVLACKHQLHRLAGVIDSTYRGEWKVLLTNLGKEAYTIREGDRIVQAIIQKEILTQWSWGELDETARGDRGLGSSGK